MPMVKFTSQPIKEPTYNRQAVCERNVFLKVNVFCFPLAASRVCHLKNVPQMKSLWLYKVKSVGVLVSVIMLPHSSCDSGFRSLLHEDIFP